MISRTFSTRIPNSSLVSWKVRYLPARFSDWAPEAVSLSVMSEDIFSFGTLYVERVEVIGCNLARLRNGALVGRQTHLYRERLAIQYEAHHDPFVLARALGFEVAPEHDGRDAQPQRPQVLFQVRLDAADDHVGELSDSVQHLGIYRRSIHHEHLRTDAAGQCRCATDASRAGPGAGDPDEGDHAVVRLGSAVFDSDFALRQVLAQHGRKYVGRRTANRFGDELLEIHNGKTGSSSPVSFSLI